jgi:hypothetical protein
MLSGIGHRPEFEVRLHYDKERIIQRLTFSYSSKINGYLYLQRVFRPLKKRLDMFSEGNAARAPVRE